MCDQVDAIFRAIQFLEANLEADITVSQIADEAGYSLFHFMRIFNRLVQHTPFNYLTRRRLSEAAREILTTDRRLIDIAQDYGFGSQESFSRAFKRMFNIQPGQWRESGVHYSHLMMPPCTKEALTFINQRIFSPPAIENREKTILYGLMSSCIGNDENSSNYFHILWNDLSLLLNPAKQRRFYEVSAFINLEKERRYIFLGIEDSNLFRPPTPFVQFVIPAGLYASIRVRRDDRQTAYEYLTHTWLAGKGYLPMELLEFVVSENNASLSEMIMLSIPIQSLRFSNQ
jgi:AraC family transcriptional regulator